MDKLAKQKVLVTGATGFVGGHLVNRLLKEGADVRVLVRKSSDSEAVNTLKGAGAEIFYGDVSDRDSVFKAAEGVRFIFHIAALFRQAKHSDSVYFDINVGGTRNVLDAAEHNQVERMVHCSTVGVHSHIPSPPANEDEPYRPGDIYQHTKCEGEKLAQERFKSGRVKGAVVRPAMIWGEGDKRMLKLFQGVARRRFPVIGDGKTLTHWVYVHDLVQGFLLCATVDKAIGQTFIFAGETPVSMSELVQAVADKAGVKPLPFKVPAFPVQMLGSLTELVCKPLGIEPPIYRRRVDFFTKTRCFDISRAKADLNYLPCQSFAEEVSNIYDYYQAEGWL